MRSTPWFILTALLVAGSAQAEGRDEARQAFHRGSQHYKLGEYKEALADFKLAFRSYEDPSFLYNIAQCERQLGQLDDAIREYRMYLADSPDAPNRDDVRVIIARLEQERSDKRAAAAQSTMPAASPTAVPSSSTANIIVSRPAPPTRTPTYKKWWVWTLVGVAAGGAAAGLAVGLTRNQPAPMATTALGTTHPFN